jgi:hypothetical protein
VRPDTNLTLAEVQSLATAITLTGGPLLLSDDLTGLPNERLHLAEQLVPLIGQRARVVDWFDNKSPQRVRLDLENTSGQWYLLGIFNWDDEERDIHTSLEEFSLPEGPYFVREFWSGKTSRLINGHLRLDQIPAHGVQVVALRAVQNNKACYLGSNLHISQGLEVTQWFEVSSKIKFHLERPGHAQGQIDLYLPNSPSIASVNQEGTGWQLLDTDIYRLQVQFKQHAVVEIH